MGLNIRIYDDSFIDIILYEINAMKMDWIDVRKISFMVAYLTENAYRLEIFKNDCKGIKQFITTQIRVCPSYQKLGTSIKTKAIITRHGDP